MPPKVKFQEGEKILCFHGPLLYEAKCVKADPKEKTVRYFVHYNGWNKNWDEWVPESRVLKYNETSLQKQRELLKAHAKAKRIKQKVKKADKEKEKDTKEKATPAPPVVEKPTKKKEKEREKERLREEKEKEKQEREKQEKEKEKEKEAAPSTPSTSATSVASTVESSASSDQPKKKRARVDPTVESEETYLTKIEVRVKIPEDLKPYLVDDWDLINRQKQLLSLPCKMTVNKILDDYLKFKLAKPNNPQRDAIIEVTQGIREYFNVMLGTQLLYKFERPQYGEMLTEHPDTRMADIYGFVHLLRLFVKLGAMLAYTPLDEKSISLLLLHIHDFLKYISKNTSNLFSVSDYIVSSPEYHRKSL